MSILENTFSWSKSRDEEFRNCKRMYYYNRYLSWGGWERDAPPKTRLAYILKNLKNRFAWKGESVHHSIEEVLKALRAGKAVTETEAVESLSRTMRADYLSSKAGKYRQDPKKNVGLFEHEYAKAVTDETWKKVHQESVDCLKNFLSSGLYRELAEDDKKSWLLIEDLEDFAFDGAKIFVKLDFAKKCRDGVEIYDWKTGKSGGDSSVQIGTYVFYAMQKWKIEHQKVRAFILNVSQDNACVQEQIINDAALEEARKVIADSVISMRDYMADPAKNIPKPEEAFPFTENGRQCDFCSFSKICAKFEK